MVLSLMKLTHEGFTPLKLTTKTVGSRYIRVDLKGDLNYYTIHELEQLVQNLDSPINLIVVSLSKVGKIDYCSSKFIESLIKWGFEGRRFIVLGLKNRKK